MQRREAAYTRKGSVAARQRRNWHAGQRDIDRLATDLLQRLELLREQTARTTGSEKLHRFGSRGLELSAVQHTNANGVRSHLTVVVSLVCTAGSNQATHKERRNPM
jgi:hypothetical protein